MRSAQEKYVICVILWGGVEWEKLPFGNGRQIGRQFLQQVLQEVGYFTELYADAA